MTQKITEEITIEHPLEEVFNITPGTTVIEQTSLVPTELVEHPDYDEKDGEIETQLENVYTLALEEFEASAEEAVLIDPKFRARSREISVQFLNTALAAVKEKSLLKQHKDKISVSRVSAKTPGTVNNNLVVADRNELLKMIRGKKEEDVDE